MIAVEGEIDFRLDGDRVEFSWLGDDEGEPASGRGWAKITTKDTIEGEIYFHKGDDSRFVARRVQKRVSKPKTSSRAPKPGLETPRGRRTKKY